MRWHEIVAEAAAKSFESLEQIIAWARSLGVKLDAHESASPAGSKLHKYAGNISIVWIERTKKGTPGAGAQVMEALCRYADDCRATISLQADDEVVLPEYYAQFGFRIVPSDSGDDVTPTGPDMERRPRTRKARQMLGSARPFSVAESQPIGVACLHSYGNDKPSYYMLFPANKAKKVQELLGDKIYDAEDVWIGYIMDTIEWTELLPKVQAGRVEHVPSIYNSDDPAVIRQNKRWQDLFQHGKPIFKVTV